MPRSGGSKKPSVSNFHGAKFGEIFQKSEHRVKWAACRTSCLHRGGDYGEKWHSSRCRQCQTKQIARRPILWRGARAASSDPIEAGNAVRTEAIATIAQQLLAVSAARQARRCRSDAGFTPMTRAFAGAHLAPPDWSTAQTPFQRAGWCANRIRPRRSGFPRGCAPHWIAVGASAIDIGG